MVPDGVRIDNGIGMKDGAGVWRRCDLLLFS